MVAPPTRTLWLRAILSAALGLLAVPAFASAANTTFSYTGGEQTYTVPAGVTSLYVTATGGHGGGDGTGGRGAVVRGAVSVTPGQTLYVEVGGNGGRPQGGFNGGGNGGTRNGLSASGGGGASDVRSVARASAGTLASRLIVAGGGGGQMFPGVGGGNAGQAGTGCCAAGPSLVPAIGGGPGTQSAGGYGGCTLGGTGCGSGCGGDVSCGAAGSLGIGGDGGQVGEAAATREGTGGGGGLYGGGGGAAVADLYVGSGGGGSSLVPSGGVYGLAGLADAPAIVISTRVPKYLALEIPVYMCFPAGDVSPGTQIATVSYIDKGGGDRHLEMVGLTPVPVAAGNTFTAVIGGALFATFTLDSTGAVPTIERSGSAVPAVVDGNAVVDIGFPLFGGLIVASSSCGP